MGRNANEAVCSAKSRDVCKPSNGVNSIEFSAPKKLKTEYGSGCGQSSSVKHIFNYLRGGDSYHAPLMSIYSKHTPASANGVK
ncbi:hypothetical protein ACQJBY_001702 [Aegilops geniculata]